MMGAIAILLDAASISVSALASWLWYRASMRQVHRVSADEEFDYRDLNRVIVALNRSNIRNSRAALASAAAAGLVAINLLFVQLMP